MSVTRSDENLAYHAARMLILLRLCGKPRKNKKRPAIKGRTLLAKVDFFLRYPRFLKKAAVLLRREASNKNLGIDSEQELSTVESQMVRYRYGPWDHTYYIILAYLVGKELVDIETSNRTEVFRLSELGFEVVGKLLDNPNFEDMVHRADLVYSLFKRYGGTKLKNFIYENFPEVVSKAMNVSI